MGSSAQVRCAHECAEMCRKARPGEEVSCSRTCIVELGRDFWRFSSPTQLPKAALLSVFGHSKKHLLCLNQISWISTCVHSLLSFTGSLFLTYLDIGEVSTELSLIYILSYNLCHSYILPKGLTQSQRGKIQAFEEYQKRKGMENSLTWETSRTVDYSRHWIRNYSDVLSSFR